MIRNFKLFQSGAAEGLHTLDTQSSEGQLKPYVYVHGCPQYTRRTVYIYTSSMCEPNLVIWRLNSVLSWLKERMPYVMKKSRSACSLGLSRETDYSSAFYLTRLASKVGLNNYWVIFTDLDDLDDLGRSTEVPFATASNFSLFSATIYYLSEQRHAGKDVQTKYEDYYRENTPVRTRYLFCFYSHWNVVIA